MAGNGVRLVSTVICDDVLVNVGGRLTMYAVFRDLLADGYPAGITRFHVVTTWLNTTASATEIVERVTVASPDGADLLAEAASRFMVDPGNYHSQTSRFRDVVFPEPGVYHVQVQRGSAKVEDLPLTLVAPPSPEEN